MTRLTIKMSDQALETLKDRCLANYRLCQARRELELGDCWHCMWAALLNVTTLHDDAKAQWWLGNCHYWAMRCRETTSDAQWDRMARQYNELVDIIG